MWPRIPRFNGAPLWRYDGPCTEAAVGTTRSGPAKFPRDGAGGCGRQDYWPLRRVLAFLRVYQHEALRKRRWVTANCSAWGRGDMIETWWAFLAGVCTRWLPTKKSWPSRACWTCPGFRNRAQRRSLRSQHRPQRSRTSRPWTSRPWTSSPWTTTDRGHKTQRCRPLPPPPTLSRCESG